MQRTMKYHVLMNNNALKDNNNAFRNNNNMQSNDIHNQETPSTQKYDMQRSYIYRIHSYHTISRTFVLTLLFIWLYSMTSLAYGWRQDDTGWRFETYKVDVYTTNEWIHGQDGNWYYIGEDSYMAVDTLVLANRQYVDKTGALVLDSEIDEATMAVRSKSKPLVIFDKSTHFLQVWVKGRKVYQCMGTSGLGKSFDDKQFMGDGITPIGEYYITVKNTQSKYYKSLGISYPNAEDAARGLANGYIDQQKYNEIVDAQNRGVQPDWSSGMGGAIMIHGHLNPRDTSAGCITISNDDVDAIWKFLPVGSTVIIQP